MLVVVVAHSLVWSLLYDVGSGARLVVPCSSPALPVRPRKRATPLRTGLFTARQGNLRFSTLDVADTHTHTFHFTSSLVNSQSVRSDFLFTADHWVRHRTVTITIQLFSIIEKWEIEYCEKSIEIQFTPTICPWGNYQTGSLISPP